MSTAAALTRFRPARALFAWEWRQAARQPLLWAVLVLLLGAFCLGVRSAARLAHAQHAAQVQQQRSDADWQRDVATRMRDYLRPADAPAPYWQDPTDIAGYSRYQLREHAAKPVLPLVMLSVGNGDLLPTRWPVKLETPFGIEPAYDFEAPRQLALGRFDLGFAVTQLMPLLIFALVVLLATFERDSGMLRLIAAQPVAPAQWLGRRVLAIGVWLLPGIGLGLSLALLAAGADLSAAGPEFLAALALVLAYAASCIALAYFVVAAWPGAARALGMLLALWLFVAQALPVLGALLLDAAAAGPSRTQYIDALRGAEQHIAATRDDLLRQQFAARADLAGQEFRIAQLDHATRQTFLAPLLEDALADWQAGFAAARERRMRVSDVLGFAALPMGVESALSQLAGTDLARHVRYEQAVRTHQLHLRDWFYPRVQAQISAPTPRPPHSYARANFTPAQHAQIPRFAPPAESGAARARAVLPLVLWLLGAAAVLTIAAQRRSRRWPEEI